MRVKCLTLRNFRNYGDLTWKPNPCLNIVSGDNAQGKTNLLEAVFFCTTGRSFRTTGERDMVNWDQESSLVRAQLEKGDTIVEISVCFNKNGGKYFLLNGKKQNRSSIFRPGFSVSFTPLDLDMIKGSPAERRKWIDLELGPYDPQYIYNLDKYERILTQRNNLLKSYQGGRTKLAEMISPWNEQLFIYGSKIINSRINLLKNIYPHLKEIFFILTSGKEEFSFNYLSTLPLEKGIGPGDLKTAFEEMSKKKFPEELARRQTLVGPHRDDIRFLINRSDSRKFGSRGQQRSVVLALKLSLIKLFYSEYGEYPILILDDVLHELDSQRRTGLDNLINGKGQVFITSNSSLGGLFNGRDGKHRVERGKIYEGED